jgi:hypothetical protein
MSGRPGSNWPPRPWQGRALPNELLPLVFKNYSFFERSANIVAIFKLQNILQKFLFVFWSVFATSLNFDIWFAFVSLCIQSCTSS